jgi:DNA-3-methyladenine glycosylase II
MAVDYIWENLRFEAYLQLSKSKCPLGGLVRKWGPCTLRQAPDLFDCLVRSIIAQFISTKAAETISTRICAAGRKPLFYPSGIMKLGHIGLKKLGLSTAKASFLMGAAELWKDRSRKRLPALQAGIEEVETLLGELQGVGPWTLDMLRIFALGKPDVFPVGDYGLKSGIAELFGMTEPPDKAQLQRIGEPWAPYRTFATWYIWRSKRNVPQS